MSYALIKDGIVANIIALQAKQEEDFPNCVPMNGIPVYIGDVYANGVFYRDGEIVQSTEMRVAELEAELATAEEAAATEALAILRGEVEA